MAEFEIRLRFARTDGDTISKTLKRLRTLKEFEPAGSERKAQGWLHGARLPVRTELIAETLTAFDAISSVSGATERCLPEFPALWNSLEGSWFEDFQDRKYRVAAGCSDNRWSFSFEESGTQDDEGWPFLESVIETLSLPVTVSRAEWTITHRAGLRARLKEAPNGLAFDLAEHDISSLTGYFRDFGELVGAKDSVTSYGLSAAPGVNVNDAYDTLFAADLPTKTVALYYRFVPPAPDLLPRFHALCKKPKDEFTIPVGSFRALPELRATFLANINKKGHELVAVLEGDEDEIEIPTKRAIKELSERTAKVLGLTVR